MSIDVRALSETLSAMPLPQLQQYAALHKNDPYIVTLALSIANQKKQMKAGQTGQAGAVPQPKVVDQQIADMAAVDPMGNVTGAQALPEDVGIGRLPAQNLRRMAGGGIASLGHYSDGGQMLKGPGDGMSDSIPATIAGKQPARLANDEFVVPADVVSHLGNGSSDAGAKQLYKMMDKVRQARTGKKAQGKQIDPSKYLPT